MLAKYGRLPQFIARGFKTIVMAIVVAASPASWAAPVTYSFSTASIFGGSGSICAGLPCAPHPYYAFASGATASGTFVYDAAGPATGTSGDGSTIYGGFAVPGGFSSSFSGLSGSVDGHSFSDLRGFTTVGNERLKVFTGPSTFEMRDILQLSAEPPLNSPNPHNLTGFDIGDYTLVNVRLFWVEGQLRPELVPDLFSNQNLPGSLPAFHGLLALDFVPLGNTDLSAPTTSVFFDSLSVTAVPEPETYALLLAGLGLLGFAAQRRKAREIAIA